MIKKRRKKDVANNLINYIKIILILNIFNNSFDYFL